LASAKANTITGALAPVLGWTLIRVHPLLKPVISKPSLHRPPYPIEMGTCYFMPIILKFGIKIMPLYSIGGSTIPMQEYNPLTFFPFLATILCITFSILGAPQVTQPYRSCFTK
tara:strand:- start:820 stop:1161 length:342 start_codon:yes stop_codon:yes gene_type:complete